MPREECIVDPGRLGDMRLGSSKSRLDGAISLMKRQQQATQNRRDRTGVQCIDLVVHRPQFR